MRHVLDHGHRQNFLDQLCLELLNEHNANAYERAAANKNNEMYFSRHIESEVECIETSIDTLFIIYLFSDHQLLEVLTRQR